MNESDKALLVQKLQAIRLDQIKCHQPDGHTAIDKWYELETWHSVITWVLQHLPSDPVPDDKCKRATVLQVYADRNMATILMVGGQQAAALFFAADKQVGQQGWARWAGAAWVFEADPVQQPCQGQNVPVPDDADLCPWCGQIVLQN